MRSDRRLAAITHCHSVQSNNRASPLDGLIRNAVERVTGSSAADFDWSESLTTADEIARLLEPRGSEASIDLVFVTDHVNETVGQLDPSLVELATSEPRIALGAEIQTVLEDPHEPGSWRDAPEVLLYGGPDRVRSPGGWHYGVSAEILNDIQSRCRPDGARRIELHRVLAYCRENRIAHAISHPLDGHFVDLAQVLEAISSCRFIEAVNGGYGSDSTRRLLRYIALHNRCVSSGRGHNGVKPSRCSDADPESITPWLLARLESGEPTLSDGIVPWGGSDAHLGRYDRVCMMYRPRLEDAAPGIPEMTRDMIETPVAELLADNVFEIQGRGNGMASVVGEVFRLIVANARRNARTFSGPRKFSRLLALAPYLAVQEILRDRRQQIRLGGLLDQVLEHGESTLARREASGPPPRSEAA